jgi:preprotein translocase subunit SecY
MLSAFVNSFKIPELRQRIFFTFALVFVCRIVATIPAPGIDPKALAELMDSMSKGSAGQFIGLFSLFSGGALEKFAVGALGIMPYISASIILQLMTAVVPQLERLSREGDAGRQKITQYTRYLTILLCVVQGFVMARALENPGSFDLSRAVVPNPGLGFELLCVLSLTTASMLLMWLGEQITDRGIGNGISLIITIGIISALPNAIKTLIGMFSAPEGVKAQFGPFHLIVLVLLFFLVTAGTVALTQGLRKIPVQYAKRVVGRKVYGGQSTYMPLRVNYSGVMPIIFAQAILMFPGPVLNMVGKPWAIKLSGYFQMTSPAYIIMYATMLLFFSYFWVATQFNPIQIADDLKRNGGYVPGIRPGKPTAEFLDRAMTRLTLAGAFFLTCIAIFPILLTNKFRIDFLVSSFFGGTSLLIMVGVMLDTMRQIESHLLNRHYDGFLKKGKLGSRKR